MLVSVTGGTGFVGAHSVAAIVHMGHRVRLLVRDASKVERALAPFAVPPGAVDLEVGDVTDEGAVTRAVRGADAVLHAASVYSFDSRRHELMRRVNERGTELVLGAARLAGAGTVIHVSSVAALLPARGRVLHTGSPVGRARETYMASKAAAERVARRHQDEGAPVVITYPPALLGPHDPNLGDQTTRVRDILRGLMPFRPLGGFPVGDVRDTAALHARIVDSPGGGPDRHFGPNRYLTIRRFVQELREVTGRSLPGIVLPARAMIPVGLLADLVQRVWPWDIPAQYGAIYTCACATRVAENAGTYGIEPRPLAETFGDTVRWLLESGHLSAHQAGRARPSLSSVTAH
ncbi:NAD-dependent epimerase/dehydratase family protein [Sphaerisporangium sp. TRM90804]|uniref:NAD-dependent epimerase/dehydratase family protein n=1 Tax=Sphaerisporangium sp. TRM90804 TaxID=3031113 RepID=UPI00244C4662|nr:NAD-dependent epimerase/dehydratase family protein [Sphaerisporangium sp. TRM90804]MDH2424472.1 NAD-dependent epimerase/dehydratase family protein [Sphaerisporangium sp. TRM90804]